MRDYISNSYKNSNGCEYCNNGVELPEDYLKGRPVGKVFNTCIDCYTSELTGEFGYFIVIDNKAVGIQYCPFCGKKLVDFTD